MAPPTAARGRTTALERRLCASTRTWLLLLAHNRCRQHLERLGRPLVEDDLGPPVPVRVSPITCATSAFAISRQLDGRLSRRHRRALRNHLRCCTDCARLAAAAHTQRAALRQLADVVAPRSLECKVFAPSASS